MLAVTNAAGTFELLQPLIAICCNIRLIWLWNEYLKNGLDLINWFKDCIFDDCFSFCVEFVLFQSLELRK